MSSRVSQLFVGGLPFSSRLEDIEEICERYGRLVRCDLRYGAGIAFAFVDYEDIRDAKDAIEHENGREFRGHKIEVKWTDGMLRRMASGTTCYRCHRTGHWVRDCPEKDENDGYRGRRYISGHSRSRNNRSRTTSRSRHSSRSSSRNLSTSSSCTNASYRRKSVLRSPSNSPSRSGSRSVDRPQKIKRDGKLPSGSASRSTAESRSRSRSHTPLEAHSRSQTPAQEIRRDSKLTCRNVSRSIAESRSCRCFHTPPEAHSRSRTPAHSASRRSSPHSHSISAGNDQADDPRDHPRKRRSSDDGRDGPRNRRKSFSRCQLRQ